MYKIKAILGIYLIPIFLAVMSALLGAKISLNGVELSTLESSLMSFILGMALEGIFTIVGFTVAVILHKEDLDETANPRI